MSIDITGCTLLLPDSEFLSGCPLIAAAAGLGRPAGVFRARISRVLLRSRSLMADFLLNAQAALKRKQKILRLSKMTNIKTI